MSKLPKSHSEAVTQFFATAVEAELLDTAKTLLATFEHDIDKSSHEMEMAMYDVLRSDNSAMAEFVTQNGFSLSASQISRIIKESPINTFRVLFTEHKGYFERQEARGKSTAIKALEEDRVELLPFLKEQGMNFSKKELPLKDFLLDFSYYKGEDAMIYILSQNMYTMDDFHELDSDHKSVSLHRLGSQRADSTSVVEAIDNSDLAPILLEQDLIDSALKNGGVPIIKAALKATGKIENPNNIIVDTTKFISNPLAFDAVLPFENRDVFRNTELHRFYHMCYATLKSNNPDSLRVLNKHANLTNFFRPSTERDNSTEVISVLRAAFDVIRSQEMADAFYALLPDDFFANNHITSTIIRESMRAVHIAPFSKTMYIMMQSKQATFDLEQLTTALEAVDHCEYFDFTISPRTAPQLSFVAILKQAAKTGTQGVFDKIHTHSRFYNKSLPQITSSLRTNYNSANNEVKHKALQAVYLMASADKKTQTEWLDAIFSKPIEANDIALNIALNIWEMQPYDILSLPVSEKTKGQVVKIIG